jgi:hypothetical protein
MTTICGGTRYLTASVFGFTEVHLRLCSHKTLDYFVHTKQQFAVNQFKYLGPQLWGALLSVDCIVRRITTVQ